MPRRGEMSVEKKFPFDQAPEQKFSEIDELNTGATKATGIMNSPPGPLSPSQRGGA